MAYHLHLIDLSMVVSAASPQLGRNIEPATSAESRLSLQWYGGNGGCLSSCWTHVRD